MNNLNKLFSVLVYYRHNIHILHWKVKGEDFDPVHTLMDKYLDRFNSFIDEIGEMMLSLNMNPLLLQDCTNMLISDDNEHFVTVDPNEDYDSEDVFKAISIIFDSLINLYKDIIKDNDLPSDCISKLDEHKYWIRIEYMYKNKRRKD